MRRRRRPAGTRWPRSKKSERKTCDLCRQPVKRNCPVFHDRNDPAPLGLGRAGPGPKFSQEGNVRIPERYNNVTQTRYGTLIFNKNDVRVGRSIELYGEYCERAIVVFDQMLSAGQLVVDVGANIEAQTLFSPERWDPKGACWRSKPQASSIKRSAATWRSTASPTCIAGTRPSGPGKVTCWFAHRP